MPPGRLDDALALITPSSAVEFGGLRLIEERVERRRPSAKGYGVRASKTIPAPS